MTSSRRSRLVVCRPESYVRPGHSASLTGRGLDFSPRAAKTLTVGCPTDRTPCPTITTQFRDPNASRWRLVYEPRDGRSDWRATQPINRGLIGFRWAPLTVLRGTLLADLTFATRWVRETQGTEHAGSHESLCARIGGGDRRATGSGARRRLRQSLDRRRHRQPHR